MSIESNNITCIISYKIYLNKNNNNISIKKFAPSSEKLGHKQLAFFLNINN